MKVAIITINNYKNYGNRLQESYVLDRVFEINNTMLTT